MLHSHTASQSVAVDSCLHNAQKTTESVVSGYTPKQHTMNHPAVSGIRSESTYMRQSIEGLDKQLILSVNLDQQDCSFNEESSMSDSSEIQSEMLRIQDILCRMDTCCHLHSLCDLDWDSVLTY